MKLAALALVVAACAAAGPVPLRWGDEGCRHCHMTLVDRRYGAEVVTTTGKAFAFDDAGCAALFLADGSVPAQDVAEVWVIDAMRPESLVPALQARFIRSAAFQTPMGSGVLATTDPLAADSIVQAAHGQLMAWQDLVGLARTGRLEHR